MNARTIRNSIKVAHIAIAVMIGLYIYSPASENYWFSTTVLYLLFPALGISGILLWKLGPILKNLKR